MDQEQFQSLVIEFMRDIRDDIRDLKQDVRFLHQQGFEHQKSLDALYQSRNSVRIKFGWQWAFASFLIAVSAVGFTQIVGKIIEI